LEPTCFSSAEPTHAYRCFDEFMVQCLLFKKEKTLHNISEVVKFKRTPNVHKPTPKHASPSTAVEEGIIRAVPSDKSLLKLVHYLYHNAVVCQDKSTTKGALCV